MNKTDELIRKILRDIRVELSSEFDRNFERQAFFSTAWQRRRSPVRQKGHILVSTGNLRRSIKAQVGTDSITFRSDLPYAAIHNEGGDIKVTARMKRFFWAKYYSAVGGFRRRKDGSLSRSKAQVQLSTEAEFWQHLALMKVGSTIRIPRRQFLGTSPELEQSVTRIITDNINEYIESLVDKLKEK